MVVGVAVVDEGIEEDEADVPAPDAMVGVAVVVLAAEVPAGAAVVWLEPWALQVRSIRGVVEDVVGVVGVVGSLRQMR